MDRALMFMRAYLFLGRVLYRLKLEGLENIPPEGGCVIVYNHAAPIVDGMTGLVIIRQRPECGAFGGAGLKMGGFLGRLRPNASLNEGKITFLAANKARGLSGGELLTALNLLKEGKAVSLAAEGELTWDGNLQYPLAPGAAWMALRAQVPVVAVVSVGGYDIMPRWAGLPRLTGRVTIRAGKPFYVHDGPVTRVTPELIAAASDRIYNEMLALIKQ